MIDGVRDAALAWHIPPALETIRGAQLLYDAPRPAPRAAAYVRSILRSNPRIGPIDALALSTYAAARAEHEAIDPDFFVSALLQESAFAPYIVSSAGAVGIAQFTYDTAQRYGVDPLDPRSAIAGSAALYASYVDAYRGTYPDPYAAALAAYDAGPGTVAYYRGVPPYPETREYIDDVYDRWSRIERDRSPLIVPQVQPGVPVLGLPPAKPIGAKNTRPQLYGPHAKSR